MATEKQARRARDLHGDRLVKLGAHALSVEPAKVTGDTKASKTFAVVAWVKGRKSTALPESLPVKEEGKITHVPLLIRESEPFQPEGP